MNHGNTQAKSGSKKTMARRSKRKSRQNRPSNRPAPPAAAQSPAVGNNGEPTRVEACSLEVVPYDENLLERSRTQWQFGDWQSLTLLQRETLQHHPDRAKLALLAAAGHLQCGTTTEAHHFVRLARDWGCGKELISRILIAGVHNSLGRAAAVVGRRDQALRHFEQSLSVGTPGAEARLLTQARIMQQVEQLQLPELAFHHPLLAVNLASKEANADKSKLSSVNTIVSNSHKHGSVAFVHQYWRSSIQDPMEYANEDITRSVRLVEIIQQFVTSGPILEIGPNAGRNLHHLYKAGYKDLIGIEISPKAVENLRKVYPELATVPIHIGPIEDYISSFEDKYFGCVFTMAVLEHIHSDSSWIFGHIARIAKVVVTIEDELRNGERHFARNYEQVFTRFGMRQIHMEDRTKWALPTGFTARVFVHAK